MRKRRRDLQIDDIFVGLQRKSAAMQEFVLCHWLPDYKTTEIPENVLTTGTLRS